MTSLRALIVLVGVMLINFFIFEAFHYVAHEKEKNAQFSFLTSTDNTIFTYLQSIPIISHISAYIHSRAPLLDAVPYATEATDSRLSTWHLPPHQVVVEWFVFVPLFIGSILLLPTVELVTKNKPMSLPLRWVNFFLFQLSLWTLISILHYKFRAWVELGEWFAMLYLLQPCHVLIAGYVVLGWMVMREGEMRHASVRLSQVLWDLQWGSFMAFIFPDTRAMIERNFFGETFVFYFEHLLLVALPLVYAGVFTRPIHHPTLSSLIRRIWLSVCYFGIHHIQIMTPLSLASGVQINYQTHLPKELVPLFGGRWYKFLIALLASVACAVFAGLVEPAWKGLIDRLARPHVKQM
jgi:hypothetical protein